MSPLHPMGQNAYLSIFGFLRISPEDPLPLPPAATLTLTVRDQLLTAQSPPPKAPSLPLSTGPPPNGRKCGGPPQESTAGKGRWRRGQEERLEPNRNSKGKGSEQKRQGGGGQAGWAPATLAEPQEKAKNQRISSGPLTERLQARLS